MINPFRRRNRATKPARSHGIGLDSHSPAPPWSTSLRDDWDRFPNVLDPAYTPDCGTPEDTRPTHQIGHAFGLARTNEPYGIQYPTPLDVARIEQLY